MQILTKKMTKAMKKFLAAVLMLVGASAIQAQDMFDSGYNRPYFGVRAGLDITCPGSVKTGGLAVDLYNAGAGFEVGAVYNIPLYKNMYFEPGLMLTYGTMGVDVELIYEGYDNADVDWSVRRFGFRVPFRVGYRLDFTDIGVHVFTGPQLDVGLIGRDHVSINNDRISESENNNLYGDDSIMKRTNVSWTFGAGVSFARNWQAEVCGAIGILDMNPGDASYRQSSVTLAVGYNF